MKLNREKEKEMSLLEKIRLDQVQARKDRNTRVASLLTTLLGEAGMVGKNAGNRESTDEEVIGVIRKFLKNNDENNRIAGDRRDSEWCDELTIERLILEAYLPKQMTADEICEKINRQPKNKGLIMKYLKENFNGQYDGKTAASVVDQYLQ